MMKDAMMLEMIFDGYRIWIQKIDEMIAYANKLGFPCDAYCELRLQYFAEASDVMNKLEAIWMRDRAAVSAELCEFFDEWNAA